MRTLKEYVRHLLSEKNLTHKEVSARARRKGHKLSSSYVGALKTGVAANPSVQIVKALAAGFGVPEQTFMALIECNTPDPGKQFLTSPLYRLWEDMQHLSAKDQEFFKRNIEMLHRSVRDRLKQLEKD